MDKYTKDYYDAIVYAPGPYIGAIQYEYTNPSSHIPGAKEFKLSPIKIIPDVQYGEIFLQITHSWLIPNIMPGRYYVSNFGRVFDMYRMKYLPGTDNGNGYINVKLTYIVDNNTLSYKTIYIHQLVNYFFNYPRLTKEVTCNHKDMNTYNNRSDNLEWIDPNEQIYHKIYMEQKLALENKKFSSIESKSACHAKITPQTAIQICELLSKGYSAASVAKIVGVHESTVTEIKYRRTWIFISKDYDFSNCSDGRVGDKIDINTVHTICRLIAQGDDIEYIHKITDIDNIVISAIKYNGLYPEIRKLYGIHHYTDKED